MTLQALSVVGGLPLLAEDAVRGPVILLAALAVLLGLFFTGIVLLTAIRVRRRRAERAQRRLQTVTGPDPWQESGSRLDPPRRGGHRRRRRS